MDGRVFLAKIGLFFLLLAFFPYFCDLKLLNKANHLMTTFGHTSFSDENRREELIRTIEHNLQKLTLPELEALYYDMTTKSYIHE